MDWTGLKLTTAKAALSDDPKLQISLSRPNLVGRLMGAVSGSSALHGKGFLLPRFRKTMPAPDLRLPELAHGLAVIVEEHARFYPTASLAHPISDSFAGRRLTVSVGLDRIPSAVWDDGSAPKQIFMRWYGFAYSFPHGDLFEVPLP